MPEALEESPAMAVEILGPLIASGRAMKDRAWCLHHQRECVLQNVSKADISLFERFLAALYHFEVLSELSPLSRFNLRFLRGCSFSWRQLFFAHEHEHDSKDLVIQNELNHELDWAQRRPGSLSFGMPSVALEDPLAFRKVLTETEDWFRKMYSQQWPDSAFQLNQNPATSFETHSQGQVLPTLIRNSHLIYWDQRDRWLSSTELLFCSFHERRVERHARHVREQVGNSMNLLCMAVIDLHSMWSWKLLEAPSLVANIHFGRKFLRDLKASHGRDDDGHDERHSKRHLEAHCAASPVPPTKRLKGKQPDPASASAAAELPANMKPDPVQTQLANLKKDPLSSSSSCIETPEKPEKLETCTKSEQPGDSGSSDRFALLNQIRQQMQRARK
eukprot:s1602_g18.t1